VKKSLLVVMALLLALAGVSCSATPAARTSILATERAATLKNRIKRFTLDLHYYGTQKSGRYFSMSLSVPTSPVYGAAFGELDAHITEAQAGRIIDYLAVEGMLDQARSIEPPNPPFEPAQRPAYVLKLSDHYAQDLGWGLPMLERIEGLRKVLDGNAAKAMDQWQERLAEQRRAWEAAATGTQPATQPSR
jgi:hypothetical protein